MKLKIKWLLLWLEGPLQAWGYDSRFGRRETLAFPTRSGILGLLCSASGRGGTQEDWLEKMASYEQHVISYNRSHNRIKLHREVQLRDFQTVGAAYNIKDKWETNLIPKKADGKKANNEGAKITHRSYLQDACFACIVALPDDEAEQIALSVQCPVWEISLGRKNCVPTEFVFQGLFLSKEEALEHAQCIANEKNRLTDFAVMEGEIEGADDCFSLSDVPLCFGRRKSYRDRQVSWFNSL